MPAPNLPVFDNGKTYVFGGMALNRLMSEIRRITPRAGNGLNSTETVSGIVLSANNIDNDNGDNSKRHPFRVIAENGEWMLLSEFSTITDGTNGGMIDFESTSIKKMDTPYAYTETTWIVIEAEVDSALDLDNWEILAVTDYTDAEEVKTDNTPVEQTRLRLLVAIVESSASGAQVIQCINTAQRVTHGLLNGLAVKVFESAPVNPNYP